MAPYKEGLGVFLTIGDDAQYSGTRELMRNPSFRHSGQTLNPVTINPNANYLGFVEHVKLRFQNEHGIVHFIIFL
jgi:hypothetical protein